MELSDAEKYILAELRNLQPFERIEVTADKGGKPDVFIIHKSSKVVFEVSTVKHVR